MSVRVRVWDLPTRLFHWLLAAAVLALIVTGKVGGNAMVWHLRLGLLVLALLLFRVVWGFAGGHWSRFSSFVRGPLTVWRYLRAPRGSHDVAGHNPLGGWSVLAMLGALSAQVFTGLFADDEIATTGPLSARASSGFVESATHFHTGWGQWLVMGLIALHLAAILWHSLLGPEGLVGPMLSGDKLRDAHAGPVSRDTPASRLLALLLLALALLLAAAIAWQA